MLRQPRDRLTYEYEFGDSWTHTLTLGQVDPLPAPPPAPALEKSSGAMAPSPAAWGLVCLAAEGACPREDVGGTPGYEEAAAWVRAGADPRHEFDNGLTGEEMGDWLPPGWHPDRFDVDEATVALAALVPHDIGAGLAKLPPDLRELLERLPLAVRSEIEEWLAVPGWDEPDTFTEEEARALTAPYRVVLDAVGDGVTLTKAGWLPPRLVEQIAHDTGIADSWIGKVNREDQTAPVLHLREHAQRAGLLRKAKGRLLRKAKGRLLPTANARRLHDDPQRLLDRVLASTADKGDFERLAGELRLVAEAAGVPVDPWPRTTQDALDTIADLLTALGGAPTVVP